MCRIHIETIKIIDIWLYFIGLNCMCAVYRKRVYAIKFSKPLYCSNERVAKEYFRSEPITVRLPIIMVWVILSKILNKGTIHNNLYTITHTQSFCLYTHTDILMSHPRCETHQRCVRLYDFVCKALTKNIYRLWSGLV